MITINRDWTLFLDRDGVINKEIKNHYVTRCDEFVFHQDALQTIQTCTALFKRILVITNQRGIGRGIMTHEQLTEIHEKMLSEIRAGGGNIDAIYYAPDTDDNAVNRKPNTGMAYQAKTDFPDIDFHRSIMVGNNISDMEFGKRMAMVTVFIKSTRPDLNQHPLADFVLDSLSQLPAILTQEAT